MALLRRPAVFWGSPAGRDWLRGGAIPRRLVFQFRFLAESQGLSHHAGAVHCLV